MVLLPAALLALSVLPAVAVAVAAPFALPQTTDQCSTCATLTTNLQSCSVTDADLKTGLTTSQWACLCEKSGFAGTAATCLTCLGTPTAEADLQSNCVSVSSQSASVSSKSASSVSPSRTTTPTGSATRTSTSSSQSTSEPTSATPGSSTPGSSTPGSSTLGSSTPGSSTLGSSTTSGATGTSSASPSGSGRTATATATGDAVANNIPGAAVPIFVAALIYQLVWGF